MTHTSTIIDVQGTPQEVIEVYADEEKECTIGFIYGKPLAELLSQAHDLNIRTEGASSLMAAAPDLLAACQAALENLAPAYSQEHLVIRKLTQAIAKAQGQTQEAHP
jgi:hypothetical protein